MFVVHSSFAKACVLGEQHTNFKPIIGTYLDLNPDFARGPRAEIHLCGGGGNLINRLTPNDPYMGRTAPLTSKRCILYIYSTNIGTEYFKHALYSMFFSLQNAVCFIMLTCLVPVLFTFYIQDVLKLKKNNSGAKGLKTRIVMTPPHPPSSLVDHFWGMEH